MTGTEAAGDLFHGAGRGLLELFEAHGLCDEVANGESEVEVAKLLAEVDVEAVSRHLVAIGHTHFGDTAAHATAYADESFANGVVEYGCRPSFAMTLLKIAIPEESEIDEIRRQSLHGAVGLFAALGELHP